MTKIVTEDLDFEEFVMEGESCIAVPFEITDANGKCEITVYSHFCSVAEDFAKLYGDRPFCAEGAKFVAERLLSEMKAAGYAYSEKDSPITVKYKAVPEKINEEFLNRKNVVMISTNDEFEEYYNDVSRDIELDDGDKFDVCFAAVEKGHIVSYAGVNDFADGDGLDINVETAEEYRNRGYGTAVAAELARYLSKNGAMVYYNCRNTNAASRRTAEKAGFEKCSATYSQVYYRADED